MRNALKKKKVFEGGKLDASLVQVSWWVQCSSAGSVDLSGEDVWTLNPLFFFKEGWGWGGMVNPPRLKAKHSATVLGLFSASVMDEKGGKTVGIRLKGRVPWR